MNLFTLTSCVAFSHHLKAKDYLVGGGTCSRLASDTIGGGTCDSNFGLSASSDQAGSTLDFNFADSFDSSSSLATPDLLLHSKATPERSEEEALQPDNHLSLSSFSNRQQLMSDQEGLFENTLLKGNLYLLLLLLMKPVIWAFIKCIKLT